MLETDIPVLISGSNSIVSVDLVKLHKLLNLVSYNLQGWNTEPTLKGVYVKLNQIMEVVSPCTVFSILLAFSKF